MAKIKVLFLSFGDYPNRGACVSLIRKLARQENFITATEIHLLVPRHDFAQLDTEVVDGITIHRFQCWDTISLQQIKLYFPEAPLLSLDGLIQKAAIWMRKRYLKQDFANSFAIHSIYRELSRLANEEFDVLIPVTGSYDPAQAALNFARKQLTPIIIYQVDPCSSNQSYSPKAVKTRKAFERRMYEESAAVITTPILLREMHGIFPNELLKKAVAMEFPNVNPHHQESSDIAKTDATCYTCVFAGAVYRQARNPAYTFRLFSALKDKQIALHMIGIQEKQVAEFIGNEELPENIKFFGTMPLEQAQQHMAEADVLINIGNIMTNQVPSKIFEYISSGKPIVNICTSHECPTLPYLEKYPYVLNLFECDPDFDEQVQQLEAFIHENAGKRVSADYIMRTYETCTAQYCAKQMLGIIKQVLHDE